MRRTKRALKRQGIPYAAVYVPALVLAAFLVFTLTSLVASAVNP